MYDVIIIGAGPAGLSAAKTLAENHASVLVIDEYLQSGGRLIGQLYQEPQGDWWNGIEESKQLSDQALSVGVTIQLNESVVDLEQDNQLWKIYTDKANYETNHIILATGAAESPFSIPGWTLPGVMSVGAAQVMTNVHRVKPGQRGVIIGVNVLSSAIAMELKLADIDLACIALPEVSTTSQKNGQPLQVMNNLLHVAHMAPSKFVQYGSKLMTSDWMKKMGIKFFPKNGVKMWDIPIMLKKAVIEIHGENQVEGVTLASIDSQGKVILGTEEKIVADFVCIAGGLYPLAELAALAGSPFYHIPELGGHVPLHSEKMETSLPGLYVAGNITGIEGAKVAIRQGVVAAYTILNKCHENHYAKEMKQALKKVEEERSEAYIQFDPNIDYGRERLQKLWDEHQAARMTL